MNSPPEFTKISTLLAEVVKGKKWLRRLGLHAVFNFWDEIVGREVALKAQPYLIRGSVLWVNVSDSVWMQQLQFQKILLLDKINQRLDEDGISDIRFRLEPSLNRSRPGVARKRPVMVPDQGELKKFEDRLADLDDEELKDAMRRLWLRSHSVEL